MNCGKDHVVPLKRNFEKQHVATFAYFDPGLIYVVQLIAIHGCFRMFRLKVLQMGHSWSQKMEVKDVFLSLPSTSNLKVVSEFNGTMILSCRGRSRAALCWLSWEKPKYLSQAGQSDGLVWEIEQIFPTWIYTILRSCNQL